MIITPNLHFNGDCAAALQLYEKAFGGKLTLLLRYSDANPKDLAIKLSETEQRYVYHAEMLIGGQRFFFSDSIDGVSCGDNMSMVVTFDTAAQVSAAYRILIEGEGGTAITPLTETTYSTCFASLKDRFGIRWEIMTETE